MKKPQQRDLQSKADRQAGTPPPDRGQAGNRGAKAPVPEKSQSFWLSPAVWVGLLVCLLIAGGWFAWNARRARPAPVAPASVSEETRLREAISKDPNSLEARLNLARWLMAAARPADALEQYQEALRIAPTDVPGLVGAGNALARLRRSDEAIQQYEAALKSDPNNAEAHANLAVLYANQGQSDLSIQHSRKAIEVTPKHIQSRLNLAAALAAKGEFKEAADHYKVALELDPDQPITHASLAMALAVLGELEQAEAHYRTAALALNARAKKAADDGRLAEAKAQYLQSVKLIPNNAQGHYELALLWIQEGKLTEARTHLGHALRIRPDYSEAKRLLESLPAPAK